MWGVMMEMQRLIMEIMASPSRILMAVKIGALLLVLPPC
jgi:hypothetical protein